MITVKKEVQEYALFALPKAKTRGTGTELRASGSIDELIAFAQAEKAKGKDRFTVRARPYVKNSEERIALPFSWYKGNR